MTKSVQNLIIKSKTNKQKNETVELFPINQLPPLNKYSSKKRAKLAFYVNKMTQGRKES